MSRLPILIIGILLVAGCRDQDDIPDTGAIEIRFDNVIGSISTQILSEEYTEEYPYTNELGQTFNLVTLRYIISEVVFEGPDGAYHADPLIANASETHGYHLIDESDISSQRIRFQDIPPGTFNKVSFTLGVEQEGVEQGAAIFIDGMFWTWNSGYIALKIEGQSPDSPGEAFGDNIEETNPFGFAYHIGGWDAVNNNQRYTLDFEELMIAPEFLPEIHIVMDGKKAFEGQNPTNFALRNSVHTPNEGFAMAQNLDDIFAIDHVHQ